MMVSRMVSLQERRKLTPGDHGFAGSRARVELQAAWAVSEQIITLGWGYAQGVFQVLVNLHYRGLVAAPVAVIGSCSRVSA